MKAMIGSPAYSLLAGPIQWTARSWMYLGIAVGGVVVLVAIILAIVFGCRHAKRKKAEAAEPVPVDEASEAPVEEAEPAETAPAEAPAEPVGGEVPVEGAPAEGEGVEIPVEEGPMPEEEVPAEPVEEPIEENDTAAIVELPEPVPFESEFTVEEVTYEEPAAPAPAPMTTLMFGTAPSQPVMPPVMPYPPAAILDFSFTARLSQADAALKNQYSELKNELLSYEGIASQIDWDSDTFSYGTRVLVKLQIEDGLLIMYIALDPKTVGDKYLHTDVSQVAGYEGVPTRIRLVGLRSMKNAKELIAIAMMQVGLTQGEVKANSYDVPYQTTQTLMELGYVRHKQPLTPEMAPMSAPAPTETSAAKAEPKKN